MYQTKSAHWQFRTSMEGPGPMASCNPVQSGQNEMAYLRSRAARNPQRESEMAAIVQEPSVDL
jgi:hypothetical protein